jgi:hypothetical protein
VKFEVRFASSFSRQDKDFSLHFVKFEVRFASSFSRQNKDFSLHFVKFEVRFASSFSRQNGGVAELVDRGGLENRCTERYRGFESYLLRQPPPSAASWRDLALQNCKAILERRVRHIETTMHYVYILFNETKTKTYTGVADDVNKRLALHNAGRVKASRPY